MTRRIIILTLSALLLLSSLSPVLAATNTLDRHQEMEKITAKVLKISIQDVKKYQQEGVGLGQLIAASVIDKKSSLTFQQVLDLRKSGKTFYQIAEEKNIPWQDYRQEMMNIRNAVNTEKIKAGLNTGQGNKQFHGMGKWGGHCFN